MKPTENTLKLHKSCAENERSGYEKYYTCPKCQALGFHAPCDECFYGRGVIKTADELLEFLNNSSGDITFHAEGHFIKNIHLSALKDLASLASRFDELDIRLAHENRLEQWRLDNK